MISTLHKSNFKFSVTFILSSVNSFDLDKPKILSFGNELKNLYSNEIAVEHLTMNTEKDCKKCRKGCNLYGKGLALYQMTNLQIGPNRQVLKHINYSSNSKIFSFTGWTMLWEKEEM